MEKAKIPLSIDKKVLEKAKSRVADLILQDSYIKEIIEELKMNQVEINDNLGLLLTMYECNKNCSNCKGLDKCLNDLKNSVPVLERNGQEFSLKYQLCSLKENENNYLIKDFGSIYNSASLMNIKNQGKISALITKMFSYIENINQPGFFLHGKEKSGKTYCCAALTNELVSLDIKCAFVDIKKLLNELKKDIALKNRNDYEDLLRVIKTVPVLVLDNLGEEKISEWSRDDVLLEIFNSRKDNNLLTIITSKYNINELNLLYSNFKTYSGYNINKLKGETFINTMLSLAPEFKGGI